MDEVVSVFVSEYETNLFTKKEDLSSQIKLVKEELKDLDKRLIGSVDQTEYETTNSVLNISSKVDSVSVNWGKKDTNISVRVEIKDDDDKSRYSSSFSKGFKLSISKPNVELHTKNTEELESLNSELMEVMGLIKGVSRKERQIRGKISRLKLEESGFEGLLQSEDMLQLIKIED